MRRAWVIVASVGALCVPAPAFAVDHVSLYVSPSALAAHSGWLVYAAVPAREFTGGEIVGVTLKRGVESHDLRGTARSTSSVAFDGRRGSWRVSLGSSLSVNMAIAPSGVARPVDRSLGCRGSFVQQPVELRGRFVLRTGTRFFASIRRSTLAGTVVFTTGGTVDCSPPPRVCSVSTTLIGSRAGDAFNASSAGDGYLGVSVRQAVTGGAWYHRLELGGFDPLVVSGSTVSVRAPPGLPLSGGGTFTAGGTVGAPDSCGTATTAGTFVGSFRARLTGWPSRTLAFGRGDAATSSTSGARPSG
jgi:hypothetical protein